MTFGERVKQARLKQHLTIAQVARAVGVSEATVSRWENNIIRANHNYIVPLCKALGTDPNTLLGWEEPKKIFKVKVRRTKRERNHSIQQ